MALGELDCVEETGGSKYPLIIRSWRNNWDERATVFKYSAEILARVRGSGALKLEPSDVVRLLIPVAAALERSAAQQLLTKLDLLVRRGEFESATRVADEVLLLEPGLLKSGELTLVRDRFQDLQGKRMPLKKTRNLANVD